MKFIVFLAVLIAATSGCSANHTRSYIKQSLADFYLSNDTRVIRHADWVISPASSIVIVPQANHGETGLIRAQTSLDKALYEQFQEQFYDVHLANIALSKSAFFQGDFLVTANIIDVKDRLSSKIELFEGPSMHPEQSVGRDEVLIKIHILEANSHALLDTLFIHSKGRFFSNNDQLPTDLLEGAIKETVSVLSNPRYARN